jgi:hypothetical protein
MGSDIEENLRLFFPRVSSFQEKGKAPRVIA